MLWPSCWSSWASFPFRPPPPHRPKPNAVYKDFMRAQMDLRVWQDAAHALSVSEGCSMFDHMGSKSAPVGPSTGDGAFIQEPVILLSSWYKAVPFFIDSRPLLHHDACPTWQLPREKIMTLRNVYGHNKKKKEHCKSSPIKLWMYYIILVEWWNTWAKNLAFTYGANAMLTVLL